MQTSYFIDLQYVEKLIKCIIHKISPACVCSVAVKRIGSKERQLDPNIGSLTISEKLH